MVCITKIIYRKIREIALCLFIIIATFFINDSMQKSEVFKLLEMEKPTSYAYVEKNEFLQKYIISMKDDYALEQLVSSSIQMVNDTYLKTTYSLGIKMRKNNIQEKIKISVNDTIRYLMEYKVEETEEYIYFLLAKGNLQAEKKNFEIKFWLEENYEGSINESLEYEFINLENVSF